MNVLAGVIMALMVAVLATAAMLPDHLWFIPAVLLCMEGAVLLVAVLLKLKRGWVHGR